MGNWRSTDCLLWLAVIPVFLCALIYGMQSMLMVKILPDLLSGMDRLLGY